ncbi:MAG: hypothetical protein VKL98_05610 [Cyanobacteriota bacterium]|nr:hypothetical protein [Cyanobacteriota bacterium]
MVPSFSTDASFETLRQSLIDDLPRHPAYPDLTLGRWEHQGEHLRLWVLHPKPQVVNPEALLADLEAWFGRWVEATVWPDRPRPEALTVGLYLQLVEEDQPYALHRFAWPGPGGAALPAAAGVDARPLEDGSTYFSDAALALPDTAIAPPGSPGWGRVEGWLGQYWSYGVAALILVTSGLFAYMMTRPCVVGGCDRLAKAEELYGLAAASLSANPTGEDVNAAEVDIRAATQLLATIPAWSSHHGAAQANLQRYRQSAGALQTLSQARAKAMEAAQLSQNPPHPVDRWVTIQLLWQQAIDRLTSIPTGSPGFDYVQQKLAEYRVNHSTIGGRIVAEEEAEANFNTAMATAKLAQQRMDTANSLAGWQLATQEWQAAIKGLTLIPQGTMVYAQAQAYLQEYGQQLQRSTHRTQLEEASRRHYDQALQIAREAAAAQSRGQWSLAVNLWQQALARAQQIPADTTPFQEAANLVETYGNQLKNAQTHLRQAIALQGLTATLGSLCGASPTPCTLQEVGGQIQVRLANQYAQPLRQALTPPAPDGTVGITHQISPDLQALINQLTRVSHQINRPLAIVDPQGNPVARYRPDLGGFAQE